jgi:uncharacterized membrane protein YbhN (UPF0104 family)
MFEHFRSPERPMIGVHSEMGSPKRGKRWLWIAASSTLGIAAMGSVLYQAGAGATRDVLFRALPFLPMVLFLEGARIGTEVLAARNVFLLLRAKVPAWALVRAQLVGYSICNVLPVGRMASEAAKAGLLKSHANLSETAAVAAVAQALNLVASAVILLPGFWAVKASGGSVALSLAIMGQCLLLAGIGATLLVVARFVPLDRALSHRLPKVSAALERFRLAMSQLPRFPFGALGWLVVNRALQVALIAVLLRAVGAAWSIGNPVVAESVLIVGGSAGDVIPGQLGAIEGAFCFFANAFGATKPNGLAVALLIHLVQSVWVFAGFVTLGIGKLGLARRAPKLLHAPFAPRLEGTSVFKAS